MEDNTNLDMAVNAESAPEEISETLPEMEEQREISPDESAVAGEEQKHRIKYNGEIRELTLQELKTAAQKGLNYDKVLSERDRLRASREFEILDSLAASEGITRAEYLDRLQFHRDDAEAAKILAGGMSLQVAREYLSLKREAEAAKAQREAGLAEEKRQAELKRKISDFKKLYPDVTRLPEEVVSDIRSGTDLIVAYQKYEIGKLKNAAAAGEQTARNREKAVGSLVDTGAAGGRYFSESELDALMRNGAKSLMEDDIWEKAVRSMAFHQKKKKG